jgi:hypothetical protein
LDTGLVDEDEDEAFLTFVVFAGVYRGILFFGIPRAWRCSFGVIDGAEIYEAYSCYILLTTFCLVCVVSSCRQSIPCRRYFRPTSYSVPSHRILCREIFRRGSKFQAGFALQAGFLGCSCHIFAFYAENVLGLEVLPCRILGVLLPYLCFSYWKCFRQILPCQLLVPCQESPACVLVPCQKISRHGSDFRASYQTTSMPTSFSMPRIFPVRYRVPCQLSASVL